LESVRGKAYSTHPSVDGRGADLRPKTPMNLRNLREVDTRLVGMIFLMRRAVTTRDDGSYAYAGRADFALLSRPRQGRTRVRLPGTPSHR